MFILAANDNFGGFVCMMFCGICVLGFLALNCKRFK